MGSLMSLSRGLPGLHCLRPLGGWKFVSTWLSQSMWPEHTLWDSPRNGNGTHGLPERPAVCLSFILPPFSAYHTRNTRHPGPVAWAGCKIFTLGWALLPLHLLLTKEKGRRERE